MKEVKAAVLLCEPMAKDLYRIVLRAPAIAAAAHAGQFIHILIPDGSNVLRRPISLMGIDRDAGTLTLAVQPKGSGTLRLCRACTGDELTVLGPLGNGFSGSGSIYFVGGGVGVAPILGAVSEFGNPSCRAFFGFRSADCAYGLDGLPCPVSVVSDDGTLGEKALVTAPLKAAIAEKRPDMILACGPGPMLKAVKTAAGEQNIPCFLSMEERMACGIGACLGCSVKVRDENSADGWRYARVCHDGPVFDAEEVL